MNGIRRQLLLAAVIALAACSSTSSSTSSSPTSGSSTTSTSVTSTTVRATTSTAVTSTTTTPTTAPSTTVAASTVPPTVAPPTTPPPTAPPAGLVACTVPTLALTLGDGDGAAGSVYTPLIFTNIGAVACTLDGHPGVSFTDGAGNQIGPSAERTTGPTPTVTLEPGGQAHATLQSHDAGLFGDECVPVQAARLKVYPPDETSAISIDEGVAVCTGAIVGPQFVIDVVQPGDGGD